MRRMVSILCGIAFCIVGCTNDALSLFHGGSPFIAEPRLRQWQPETPVPTPTPVADFGDGHDGVFTATGADVVNDCAPITAVSGMDVATDDTLFGAGDRVLLWQVQDMIATSGDPTPLTPASMGLAGVWQLARVTATDPAGISVDITPLDYDDGVGRSAQVCRVPEFTDVTVGVGDRIDAPIWSSANGGGVVAFFVSGTLDVTGTLSASERGFWGGEDAGDDTPGSTGVALDTSSGEGGSKGHGLDGRSASLFGRGNYANGAGGGNEHSAGGGGGGNAGAGGAGGKEWEENNNGNPATAGLGGAAIDAGYPSRLAMGGGGALGNCHHGGCDDGGDGGGLILIFARFLAGNGTLVSNGRSVPFQFGDAASGGGAGGSIVVVVQSSSFSDLIGADGGDGSDAEYDDADKNAGPGGGGGGGRIYFEAIVSTSATPTFSAVGGDSGVNLPDTLEPWGAAAGGFGVIEKP